MASYSDLLYLIGAMVIYSLLVVNVNAMILKNQQTMTTSEVQYGAISVAQGVINQVQWMNYEAFTTGNEEATETQLEKIENSDWYKVYVEIEDINVGGSTPKRKVEVKVTSAFMNEAVRMAFIKTDY